MGNCVKVWLKPDQGTVVLLWTPHDRRCGMIIAYLANERWKWRTNREQGSVFVSVASSAKNLLNTAVMQWQDTATDERRRQGEIASAAIPTLGGPTTCGAFQKTRFGIHQHIGEQEERPFIRTKETSSLRNLEQTWTSKTVNTTNAN